MILKQASTWLKFAVVTLIVSAFASSSFAAVDMFLVIKNEKGKVVARCEVSKDGSFECPSPMTKGTYTASLEWSWGTSNSGSSSSSSGMSSGRTASTSSSTSSTSSEAIVPVAIVVSYSVKSPRDAASGMATGKRQHKPVTFTAQLDKSSPQLGKSSPKILLSSITIDEDCDGISGTLSSKNSDGKHIEIESWSWGVSNK